MKFFSVAALVALIGVAAAQPVADTNVEARTCMCVPNNPGPGCVMNADCYNQ